MVRVWVGFDAIARSFAMLQKEHTLGGSL
jgi:hypothetical protein